MESNDYEDLFDLYLEDELGEEAIPEEFIISSKIVFLSNSEQLPAKVKPHTLSFTLEKSKEEGLKNIEDKTNQIVNEVTEEVIDVEFQKKALEDLKFLKKSKGTLQDYLKLLVIRSSGVSETTARSWVVAQG
jgi:hypothetical protein